jgi:hypothetical protein
MTPPKKDLARVSVAFDKPADPSPIPACPEGNTALPLVLLCYIGYFCCIFCVCAEEFLIFSNILFL